MFDWFRRAIALGSVTLLAACGGSDGEPTVTDRVTSDARYTILAEAVMAAGLGGALAGPGPFTLFAPTDAAFAALLGELGLGKSQLLADRALLSAVLQYHVVPGNVPAAAVPLGLPIGTLQGGIFKVDAAGGALVVTDGRNRNATITATDTLAGNGVVHTVDRVLLPANRDIVQTALALPQFSLLVEAVVAAGLQDALSAPGPLTVFAPTNAAFAALLAELGTTKEALFADTALLTAVLTYHVLPARVLKAQLPVGAPIRTLQGSSFSVDAGLAITDARGRRAAITATDVLARNGVIHVLDRVILP